VAENGGVGGIVRDHLLWNTMKGKFLFVKVPKAVPAHPSGKDRYREGKTLGREKGKAMGSGLFGITNFMQVILKIFVPASHKIHCLSVTFSKRLLLLFLLGDLYERQIDSTVKMQRL
jgi:hypothetical protein